MDSLFKNMSHDSREAAKIYMAKNHVPQLFEVMKDLNNISYYVAETTDWVAQISG